MIQPVNTDPIPPDELSISGKLPDKGTVRQLTRMQLIYSVCGLILGFCCVLGGIVLLLHGVAGSSSWTAKILGGESHISDAAPGAILFIVGVFMVLITRFRVRIKGMNDKQSR